MEAMSRLLRIGSAVAVMTPLLMAAAAPSLFARVEPGLWEIGRPGAQSQRMCVADASSLAQFEHRSARCSRELLRDTPGSAVIAYDCPGRGFGRSEVTLLTPRSLRIDTQGISGNAPFKYVLQARRIANCSGH
jgi:hypothetical protein